jgi:two-component system response regulator
MSSKLVLLVEDNVEEALLARRAVQSGAFPHQLVVAGDGAEALDLLFGIGRHAGRPPLRPHLILLDLNLPHVTGLNVLRRLRAAPDTALVPIVVLTSSQEEHDLLSSYALGANSYIRKPVNYQQFVEALRHLEAYWLTLNEAPPAA